MSATLSSPQSRPNRKTDDIIRISDLFSLCANRWYWFVISIVIAIVIAVVYLLTTPPVYTRSAALLIKDDQKGDGGIGQASGVLADIDLFQTHTNMNNEMLALQSPAVMFEVVRRMHLDISYHTDGRFYQRELYGADCPYAVTFGSLQPTDAAAFTLTPIAGGKLRLTDFKKDNTPLESEGLTVIPGKAIQTPVGRVTIYRTESQAADSSAPVYVLRTPLQSTVNAYSARLGVTQTDEKSTIVNLSFVDVNPHRAEDILNTLIAVYNENWMADKNQIAVSTSAFITERLGVIEQELGHVDERISSYKSANLLPDVQEAAKLYMQQSSETDAQLLTLGASLAMARNIRTYLTEPGRSNQLLPANSGIDNAAIEQQISQYNTSLLRRDDLMRSSSEQNPLVTDMDQALQDMRNNIIRSIDHHIAALTTQLNALQRNERQTTARIAANPTQGRYLLSVERQQKVKEALYIFLLQKREENELSKAFTAYNTRLITPPSGDIRPSAPSRGKVLLIAFALGLMVPIGIILVLENANTKLRGRKDLEMLTLPFAGEIPQIRTGQERHTIFIRQGTSDMLGEAFRVLRTNLEFIRDGNTTDKQANVSIVTSFNPGSGKTFLTMNTAATFAMKQKKVLVIDGDLRHGSASAYLGHRAKGLSDYLAGLAEDAMSLICHVPGVQGLDLLPAGTTPPNPTELLADARLSELISHLREQYDQIFIDCPPINIVADTQIIAQQADRTLFVVRAGLLERDMLPELQRYYTEGRFKRMALILNGTRPSRGRYAYGYGYGNKNYYGGQRR